jgi:hypothetical protein
MVALAASLDGAQRALRHSALVELKSAALDGGELRAGAAHLQPTTLPYSVAADAP